MSAASTSAARARRRLTANMTGSADDFKKLGKQLGVTFALFRKHTKEEMAVFLVFLDDYMVRGKGALAVFEEKEPSGWIPEFEAARSLGYPDHALPKGFLIVIDGKHRLTFTDVWWPLLRFVLLHPETHNDVFRYRPIGDEPTLDELGALPGDERVGVHWERLKALDQRALERAANDDDDAARLLYLPKAMAYGDYSGGVVERANQLAFNRALGAGHERRAELDGTVFDVYGSHGASAIGVRLTCEDAAVIDMLVELVEGEPVLDEDALYEVEEELRDNAYADYGRDDFVRALEEALGITLDASDDVEDIFYEKLRESDWGEARIETGGSVIFPIDDMVEATTLEDLEQRGIAFTKDDEDE